MNYKLYSFLTAVLTGLLFLCLNLNGQVNLEAGLVGHFPFDGNAKDYSTYNLHGTVYNATLTSGLQNNPDSAYYFNGVNAYINYSNVQRDIIDTLTISTWINTTSDAYQWIVGKYLFSADRGFHLVTINGYVHLAGRNSSNTYINGHSTTPVNDGEWHHIMGVIYGNTWEIWIDCRLDTTIYSAASSPNLVNNEPLTIGNYHFGPNGNHQYFKGTIDEVRLYNRLLSLEEKDLICSHNLPEPGPTSPLTISIYPNPTENRVHFNTHGMEISQIQLHNSFGTHLQTFPPVEFIDLGHLSSGTYILKILSHNSKEIFVETVVKVE